MPYDIILAGVAGLVAVILLVIRTNSAVVFFSLCAGSVLANQLGGEASLISSTVIKDGDLNNGIVYISLIVLPPLFSAIFLRKSIASSKFLFNIAPSFAVSLLAVLLVVPLLPGGIRVELSSNQTWDLVQKYQPIILVGGVLSSILLLWLSQPKDKKHKKHKK